MSYAQHPLWAMASEAKQCAERPLKWTACGFDASS